MKKESNLTLDCFVLLTLLESLFWMIAVLLSVYLCVSQIYTAWKKCVDNPVIMSFSHKPMFIGEIPFPAVTICPQTKFVTKKFNYTDVYRAMVKLDGNDSRVLTENE